MSGEKYFVPRDRADAPPVLMPWVPRVLRVAQNLGGSDIAVLFLGDSRGRLLSPGKSGRVRPAAFLVPPTLVLVAPPHLDPDRRADETELLPELVDEEPS